MTLRIFQVTSDGVAIPVTGRETDREIAAPKPTPSAAPKVTTSAAPAAPERWTGSSEWDKLRSRLREAEPRVEPQSRRRR